MSLKDDISRVKEELSTEEQFFTSFFKVEKFYKKYKIAIISVIVIALVSIIGSLVYDYISEKNLLASNEAYNKVLENPKDTSNLQVLKETNKKLFEIAQFKISQNNTQENNVEYLKEIAQYNKAVESNDIATLNKLILNPNFILKDFAKLNKALILIEKKEYNKAKLTVNSIPEESSVNSLAAVVKHFLLTK